MAGPDERVGGAAPTPAAPVRGSVLVVEDEPAIADVIRRYLERDGYRVTLCASGRAAIELVVRDRPTAVVLDIGLPDLDGIAVCQQLRARDDWTPILFVTARDDDADRVLGLEVGADDYLVKPFNPRELVARLHSVLRRAGGGPRSATVLQVGSVRLDVGQRRVWIAGAGAGAAAGTVADPDTTEVELTVTEFNLLAHLMRSPGQVFERATLLRAVWGYLSDAGLRTVDAHIAAVRAKLGAASPIRTVRGVGYAVQP